eukprot:7384859-Prymnesium_polylepis.2
MSDVVTEDGSAEAELERQQHFRQRHELHQEAQSELVGRHEEFVRALSEGARVDASDRAALLAPLLHERCSVFCRDGFSEHARDVIEPALGRKSALESPLLSLQAAVLRLEPAELLHMFKTRACNAARALEHRGCRIQTDVHGERHAQTARWSADGLILRLTLVDDPPPSHRSWLEAVLRGDGEAVRRWLAPDAVMLDEDGQAAGADDVVARLCAWGARCKGCSRLELSRTTHPTSGSTRLHVLLEGGASGGRNDSGAAGTIVVGAAGGAAGGAVCSDDRGGAVLLQETVQWATRTRDEAHDEARRTRDIARAGGAAVRSAVRLDVAVVKIRRRVLRLPEGSVPPSLQLPLELWTAAALAGSEATLIGVGYDDDDAVVG